MPGTEEMFNPCLLNDYWKEEPKPPKHGTLLCFCNLFWLLLFKTERYLQALSSKPVVSGIALYVDIVFDLQDLVASLLHTVLCPGRLTLWAARHLHHPGFSCIQPMNVTMRRQKGYLPSAPHLPPHKSPLSVSLVGWFCPTIGRPWSFWQLFPTALQLHDPCSLVHRGVRVLRTPLISRHGRPCHLL